MVIVMLMCLKYGGGIDASVVVGCVDGLVVEVWLTGW